MANISYMSRVEKLAGPVFWRLSTRQPRVYNLGFKKATNEIGEMAAFLVVALEVFVVISVSESDSISNVLNATDASRMEFKCHRAITNQD